jgi:RNA polymerase subunit RPABC4/transcription elongation factor Spt4
MSMRECIKCGEVTDSGERICQKCGSKEFIMRKDSDTVRCPTCGSFYGKEKGECETCGVKLHTH